MELLLDPLPETGPAVVTYAAAECDSVPELVGSILQELETLAVKLFPDWLPEGGKLDGPGGGGMAAARVLAMRMATGTRHFGPFLAELAAHAIQHRDPFALGLRSTRSRAFPAEVRAAGLARVVGAAFRRCEVALVVHVPEKLSSHGETVLVAGSEWLAHQSGMGVWLVGPEVKRVETVHLKVPEAVARLARELPPSETPVEVLRVPPLRGEPARYSEVEQAVEKALLDCPWAHGREWNQTYASTDSLFVTIRTDLMWAREKCVVELDGPEHRTAAKAEMDRIRDRRLERDGFTVLRFTNEQVLDDLPAVLRRIKEFLLGRRLGLNEGAG
ncbi:DUF559 domain-containing protein [Herbidospora sp. NBRC 101105]|uniref:endonuclease domain-containing protein n=1 Tax=Herbidospora sp. NBRC 101105 TaxID=3032195 RepID=UPI0024A5E28F|nr:DUF559 domain-containing protein [Herbidospora sp. NBRC 101105]GLX92384.1 hypothetical protein Hesp01_03340 [Herbidospora sp. NBRC 101105]